MGVTATASLTQEVDTEKYISDASFCLAFIVLFYWLIELLANIVLFMVCYPQKACPQWKQSKRGTMLLDFRFFSKLWF